jgi:hypothetical protein
MFDPLYKKLNRDSKGSLYFSFTLWLLSMVLANTAPDKFLFVFLHYREQWNHKALVISREYFLTPVAGGAGRLLFAKTLSWSHYIN